MITHRTRTLYIFALISLHHCAHAASLAENETEQYKISIPGINWRFDDAVMSLSTQEQLCESMKVFTTSAQLCHLVERRKQDFSSDTMMCFLEPTLINPPRSLPDIF